ncbi:diguanylate cyclase [Marinomonas ushuaiensis DSM 15871]|uniref:Diguanylate cyclase n=1 Tax=Marinomonas ushuaiensis DSM 15871 TaxID=1122207 RepID=X7E3L6_9GAMM|nr:EAL domain-containing protein [Marinomonas ushuaiensis]ETX10664.1 diguanylate cyclase [Marinomonas ushuaiensis DSM 15871]
MNNEKLKQPSAAIASSIAFLVIALLGGYWTVSTSDSIVNQQQSILKDLSRTQASVLERRLSAAVSSARFLSYEVEHRKDSDEWFDDYSSNLIKSISDVEGLQLAPDGIITRIYPLEKSKIAIGFNILAESQYQEEVLRSIKENKLIAVGPVKLLQGDEAIIARVPVFLNSGTQREIFWGFASAFIYLDSLIESTKLKELERQGYQYRLSKIKDNNVTVLSSSDIPLTKIKATTELVLPVGTWTLEISKTLGPQLTQRQLMGYGISIIVAFLLSLALYAILIQPQRLRILVTEKTIELQELAYLDPLTGLPNRRYLQDKLLLILQKNMKNKRLSAFIYFDLDNFKRINDTIGHDIGDKVLVLVAEKLNRLKGPSDKVVRLGGDEFGILLDDINHPDDVAAYADKVLKSVQNPFKINAQDFILSTSLGIAMIPEHGDDLVTIMQNADMALYQAKHQGKNQFSFYTEKMKINTYELIKEEEDLAKAIKNNEFELYYQPQFDLHTNQVFGAEALIRWNHPEKGLTFPDHFIPLAENTGKIIELGHWIVESGISYLGKRKKQGMPEIMLHINLSSKQLSDPTFVSFVQKLLLKYDVPATSLGFEITETSILEDVELAKKMLQTFQNMGICIAIDDFGTGYSSLAQLKNLPVTLLKIDRSFVMDLEEDEDDRKIIEAIIAMAHKLNIKVLAEGIETREQWIMLESFNCDFGQGYYVSKAVTADKFNRGLPITHHDI